MKEFVHLHLHTEYSILDGMANISEVVKKAKQLNMPALAMTDHGNMYGAVNFYKTCKAEGIKPILGTEFYVCDDLNVKGKIKTDDDEGYSDRRHLILLAKNEEGYKNLCTLNSIAFRDGFYYKPRIDLKTVAEHSGGLICLSACIGGDIPQAILKRDFKKAEELVVFFKNTFGEDFYLELQNQGLEEQEYVNAQLKAYAKKYDVKTVATNDVHYVNKKDASSQDVLMCVQMKKDFDDDKRLRMPCDEFYLKSYDEMAQVFSEDLDALDTTVEIANKCSFNFVFGVYMFPRYVPETGQTPIEFIRDLINEGISVKYGEETEEIRERVEMELSVIEKQGFIEYYLIVWDYINAARKMGISVGPGRGSGAGSIVAYLINITDIDPLKYGLYFERFLNSERVSAPDFDIDFEDVRRDEVIEYVRRKYGYDRVAKIVTFGTMAAKNAIRDVGRTFKLPLNDVSKITKAIPKKVVKNGKTLDITRPFILRKVFGFYDGGDYSYSELVDMYNDSPEIKKVADYAMVLEDSPRQASTHACGVIIGADVLDKLMPLSRNGDDITTQYVGSELEKLGFLKMDFLGLRNLSDIKMCIQYVKENYGVDVVFDRNSYDDKGVYELISSGNTTAIFQIESVGFQRFLSRLKPTCLEDIIAAVSLYRPGPMDSIDDFIKNKHNPHTIVYDHPLLEPILKQTYGCIVYQEQVMKIVQDLAGYTLGQADNVRRMMGKKQVAEMEKEEKTFIYGKEETVDDKGKVSRAIDGCLKRGVSEDVARKVWNLMKEFAKYAFNKSHAAAYSIITYQTAYLKCYYEAEFLTSILNNRITNIEEITKYVSYAKEEKIEVLPPDINESVSEFSVKDKKIRFGLAAIKNVGIAIIDEIILERNNGGKFKTFEDFLLRCAKHLNKRVMESLIFAGAFDCFNVCRSRLIAVYEDALDRAIAIEKQKNSDQISFFTMFKEYDTLEIKYPEIKEYDNKTKLFYEKSVAGVYLTGHPLSNYQEAFKKLSFSTAVLLNKEVDEETGEESYTDITDGMQVEFGGIVTDFRKIVTKSGQFMGAYTVEDYFGQIECVAYSRTFEKLSSLLEVDSIVKIKGKLKLTDGREPSVIIESASPVELKEKESIEPTIEKQKYLVIDANSLENLDELTEILTVYDGDVQVFVKKDGKNYKMSKKVRYCRGLLLELNSILEESDITYLEKE